METQKKDYAEVLDAFNKANISENKTTKAQDSHNVPAKGKIIGYSFESVGEPTAHVVFHFDNRDKCSLSRFRGQAHFGSVEKATFVAGKKDQSKIYLKSSVLNKHLPADQARLVCDFLGKSFTAKRKAGLILPYGKEFSTGEETLALKELATKDFWEIEIQD